jgi:glycosyltransferase involved in cell wall biosynthesis
MMAAYDSSHATVRESVESVLAQTEPNVELIVVDDGSAEPIAHDLRGIDDSRLRVVRHRRTGGVARARNTALRLARSPLVSQLDADDVWHPDYLESILPCFDDPAIGLAYANVGVRFHPDGRTIGIYEHAIDAHPIDTFPQISHTCPVPSATPTMRTEAVRAVGGYAPWLRFSGDYHLYLKLARAGWRFAFVNRALATYSWPQPHRGESYNAVAHRRDTLKMWTVFTARHPLTRGAARQVARRLRRELRRLAPIRGRSADSA